MRLDPNVQGVVLNGCEICEDLLAAYRGDVEKLVPLSRAVLDVAGNFQLEAFDDALNDLRIAMHRCEMTRTALMAHQHRHATATAAAS
jgi:hypothetical protein